MITTSKPHRYARRSLARTFAALAAALSASAQGAVWIGNTDATLATSANWDALPVSGDAWTFNAPGSAGASLTNDLATSSAFNVAGITFSSTATTGYTISGGAFTLTGDISHLKTTGVTNTISSNIAISGTRTAAMGGGGNPVGLTLSGNLSGSGSLAQTGTGSGVSRITFSGDNSGFSGAFSADNSASTRTSFSVATAGSSSAAWTFNRNVGGGVSLDFANGTISYGSLAGGGQIRTGGANNVIRVGDLGTDTTFSGIINGSNATNSNSLSILKVGSGTLALNGTNVYGGGLNVRGGTVSTTNTAGLGQGTITIGDTSGTASAGISTNISNNTLSNPIVVASGSSGTASITNTSGGGTTTVYSGGITLNKDLTINAWGAAASGGTTNISGSVTGTGNLTIDGNNNAFGSQARLTNASNNFAGNVTIQNAGQLRTVNGALTSGNAVSIDSTSQLNTNAASLTIAGLNGSGSVVVSGGSSTLTLGGSGTYSFSGGISNSGSVTTIGTGSHSFSGALSYSGNTTVSASTSASFASTSTILFNILNAGVSNQILGSGNASFGGSFLLNLSGVTDLTGAWSLVDVGNLNESFISTFKIEDQANALTFSELAGVWTSSDNRWSFDESTGVLTAIPEPATVGVVSAALALGFAAVMRRRRS